MKLKENYTTIIIVIIAVVGVYFITRSDIFQMRYYQNPHDDPGGKF